MTDQDLAFLGLVEAGRKIAAGELSPVELTNAMLGRIDRLDGKLNSFATVMAESAVAEAARAEAEIGRGEHKGPLHGVPVAAKDLCDTSGVATSCGMPMLCDRVPTADATVVRNLRAAGAVIIGKAQLTEGALALHHPDIAVPLNPWAEDRWVGASSSGSGAATAAGLCFGALGSDTGGSIRFPSLAHGLVGIKPTWGRVSRHGVFPLSETLDHIGPMARAVEDAAAMLGALAGRDPDDPTSLGDAVPDYLGEIGAGIAGVRLGIDPAYCSDGLDPAVAGTIQEAVAAFRDAGAELREVKMPAMEAALAAWVPICATEAALAHSATYPAQAAGYSEAFRGLLEAGTALTAMDYANATIARRQYCGDFAMLMQQIDLLIAPVMATPIPSHDDFVAMASAEGGLDQVIYYTALNDMTGSPTISLPGGLDANGAPLGFQLVGRHLSEGLLCRAGRVWQDAADWRDRRPPLAA